MPDDKIDYEVLDDDERWADPYDCAELLAAGIWFLYDTLHARYPMCPLVQRITRHGDEFNSLYGKTKGDSSKLTNAEMANSFSEMNLLGTLGHSLWHLRNYIETPGLKYELRELSKVVAGEQLSADSLRLRGQGFLLLAAASIAKQGFDLEFISRRKDESTPDFFALRDGNRFCCEATSRYPRGGDFSDDDYFWSVIIDTVSRKTHQFQSPEFQNGVLIIDCTPVWDSLNLNHISPGGKLVYYFPPELGGPKSGSAPIVRYDTAPAAPRLRNLENTIEGTGIHTIILWKNQLLIGEDRFRRLMSYRVLGTIKGANFWSYFEKALVFPGPGVEVKWD